MPRKPRFVIPGVPQHIVQRGNNRQPCFYGDEDYRRYLDNLKSALANNDCALHAYVLMTNHVHMLVTPSTDHGLAHLMQDLGRKYVRYINTRYQRTGTLWEGRYKASLIDSEAYLLTCMRYIEMNPVRAHMVSHPGEYLWSSFDCNAHGKSDALVRPHRCYQALACTVGGRRQAYQELFGSHLSPHSLGEIRDALNQELALGRDDFKDTIESITHRQTRRGQDGRPRLKDV